jgi:hypothetical protein
MSEALDTESLEGGAEPIINPIALDIARRIVADVRFEVWGMGLGRRTELTEEEFRAAVEEETVKLTIV